MNQIKAAYIHVISGVLVVFSKKVKPKKKGLKYLFAGIAMCCFFMTSCKQKNTLPGELKNLTGYVNPYIGTTGFGNVFLAANVPFGYVQVGPTQHSRPPRGGEWCSGYNYSDSILIGFGHLHLSGTGVGDLGDISLLPVLDGG